MSEQTGTAALVVTALRRMPEVRAGDDLVSLTLDALRDNGIRLQDDDLLVVSSKVVSKAAGLAAPAAERLAVLEDETEWVVAERWSAEAGVTRVVKAKAGPVMAAAGVDASNTGGAERLLLLPRDPDLAARELRAGLCARTGVRRLGVVLSDTAGRAWRVGQVDFALGAAGVAVTDDLRGGVDADGRPLAVTTRAVADEVAAAADLVKGKAYAVPVAHLRGLPAGTVLTRDDSSGGSGPGAGDLVRTGRTDWFGLGRAEAVRAALGVPPGSALATRVGLPSTAPESAGARVARAVAVAIHDQPDVGVDVASAAGSRAEGAESGSMPAQRVVVTAPDPVDLGIAVARLQVALHGEWLDARIIGRGATDVTLDVAEID